MSLVAAPMPLSEKKVSDAVAERTVEVFFQKSPGWDKGDKRGIEGLKYSILLDGGGIQTGTTKADGKIIVTVRGIKSELQLMDNGNNPVASYTISICDDPLESENTLKGRQQRLRMLGYQLGHSGSNSNGVDDTPGSLTERSVLDFQADHGLRIDGTPGNKTQKKLIEEVDKKP